MAFKFTGIRSTEGVVVCMILVAFGMLLVLAFTLFAEWYAHFVHEQLKSRWSVCTIDPPFVNWRPTRVYACFLSHYKMGALELFALN